MNRPWEGKGAGVDTRAALLKVVPHQIFRDFAPVCVNFGAKIVIFSSKIRIFRRKYRFSSKMRIRVYTGLHGSTRNPFPWDLSPPFPWSLRGGEGGGGFPLPPLLRLLSLRTAPPLKAEVQKKH